MTDLDDAAKVDLLVHAILNTRNALIEEDYDEACHQLYSAAVVIAPDPFHPWDGLEALVSEDNG